MKFYSEQLDKCFDTASECEQAELELKTRQEEEQKALEEKSSEKKKYAKAIEIADAELEDEYKKFEEAKKNAKQILAEAEKKCDEILDSARESLYTSQQKKLKAIQEFNEKFGPYNVQYTGEKARREMTKHLSWLDNLINSFWF